MLMVGVYPDHALNVNFPKGITERPSIERPTTVHSLTLAVSIGALPAGKWHVEPIIRLPNGQSIQSITPLDIEASEAGSINLLLKFTPLLVPMEGIYKLEFEINGEKLSFPLTIQFLPKIEALG